MVENVITSKLEIQGYENIKQIKDEITKLRAQMKELTSGTEEYKETADKLVQTEYQLKTAMSNARKDNSALKGSYNDLANQMSALKKVWKETTDSALRTSYGQQINELNTQLKGLDATTGNFQRNVGDYKNQLKLAKKELAQLTEGTEEYNKKLAECAEIQHNYTEQQELIKNSSKDLGDQLANVTQIGAGLVGGFSALNAAMGLFGKETDDVQKAMLKVQQYMAIVQGLQGMEGMFKKAQQLSTALGLVKAATVENTIATEAEATASVAAGAALETEAVATKGATAAQKGLNAAMKANPIGAILAVLIALGAAFVLFKDKIKDLVGWTDESSKKFDGFKAVISGIGSVVSKFLIKPIEDTINIFKTLGKTFKSVFKGDWQGAKDALKEGVENYADSWKNAIDVVGNYQEAAAQKRKELEEKRIREEAEARSKDLDSYIKDNEAKYGSDYKFTREGIENYREYYKKKIEMYDKDTEEYKQAIRDRDAYERLVSENSKAKLTEQLDKAQAFRDKMTGIVKNWEDKVFSMVATTSEQISQTAQDSINEWNNAINEMFQGRKNGKTLIENYLIPDSDEFGNSLSSLLDIFKSDFQKPLLELDNNGLVKDTEENAAKLLEARNRVQQEITKNMLRSLYKMELDYINDEETLYKRQTDLFRVNQERVTNLMGDDLVDLQIFEKDIFESREKQLKSYVNELSLYLNDIKEILGKDSEIYKTEFEKINSLQMEYNNQMVANANDYHKRLSTINRQWSEKETDEFLQDTDNLVKAVKGEYELYTSSLFKNGNQTKVYRKMVEDVYEIQKSGYEDMIENLQYYLDEEYLTAADRLSVEQELTKAIMELDDLELQHQIDNNNIRKDSINEVITTIQNGLNEASNTLGNFSNAYTGLIESQLNMDKKLVNSKLKAGKITKEQAESEVKFLEEKAEKEYEKTKGIQIAQAITNTLAGALGGFMQCVSQFGLPYGPIAGAALATSTLAYGYAQVQQIRATNPYSNSSSIDTGVNAASTPTIDEYSPNRVSNITGAMETENLKNALQSTPLWVSVQDINSVQNQVKVKDRETSF